MLQWLALISTIVASLYLVYYVYLKWAFSYWERRGVAQIKTEGSYGNCKGLIRGETSLADTYLEFYRVFKKRGVKHGGVYTTIFPVWVVIEPKLIKTVMSTDFPYFTAHFQKPTFNFSKSVFSENLFSMHGAPWRNLRKKLTPTFTSGKMKMMFETLVANGVGLEKLIDELANVGEPLDIKDILSRFTTDNIASCAFGIDGHSIKDPDSIFRLQTKQLFNFSSSKSKAQLVKAILQKLGLHTPIALKDMEAFFRKLVRETIAYRESNNVYRKDFMHLMIQLKNRGVISDDNNISKTDTIGEDTLTEDEIVAQCLIFFIAGFETSATTMTFALLELAPLEDVQTKMRKEINEVLDKHNGNLTYEALSEMVYLDAVIEESLRKHPPVSNIPRLCTKDYKIPGEDVIIQKGTQVLIPAIGLHRDPDYFPNPDKFDPERFMGENKSKILDYTYLPFGEGPRLCIGLRFGVLQSKVGLVSLLKNHKVAVNEKTKLPMRYRNSPGLISLIDGGLWLNVTKV